MEKRKKWVDKLFEGKDGERPIDNILGEKLLYGLFAVLFLICIFIRCTIVSEAASETSTVLPYACITNPDALTQEQLDFIVNGIYEFYGDDISDKPFVVFKGYEGVWYTYSEYTATPLYRVYVFESDNLAVLFSSGTTFSNFAFNDSSKYIDATFVNAKIYAVQESTIGSNLKDNYRFSQEGSFASTTKRFYGDQTPVVVPSGRYTGREYNWNYPVYCNKKLICTDSDMFKGYFCTQGRTVNGEITPYDPAPDIDDGDVDDEDITPYTPPTPPSWDDTISVGENLKNYIQWLGSVVSGSIANLGNNIKKQFDNLIGNLKGFLNKIIGALNNGFQNVFDNIKGLFEPLLKSFESLIGDIKDAIASIQEKIDYITEPVDATRISTAFTSSTAYTDVTSVQTAFNTFKGVFDNASEPNEYKIPLNLQNVPLLHTDVQYIDLGVILPVRNIIRAFVWTMCTFGLFVTVVDAIPNYINGGQDE